MFTTTHSNGRYRIEQESGFPFDPSRIRLLINGRTTGAEMTDAEAIELAEMLLVAAGQDDLALVVGKAL